MEDLMIWAPLLFGAIIGWIVFYFIRKYEKFNAKDLGLTIAAFIGGDIFTFLLFIFSQVEDKTFHLWYLLGFSIGFIIHLIYQFIISICFNKKRFNYRARYQLMSGCNISAEEKENCYQLSRKADKLTTCFKNWQKGKLSEEEMITYIKQSHITKSEYDRMIDENSLELLLDDDIISVFISKGFRDFFID